MADGKTPPDSPMTFTGSAHEQQAASDVAAPTSLLHHEHLNQRPLLGTSTPPNPITQSPSLKAFTQPDPITQSPSSKTPTQPNTITQSPSSKTLTQPNPVNQSPSLNTSAQTNPKKRRRTEIIVLSDDELTSDEEAFGDRRQALACAELAWLIKEPSRAAAVLANERNSVGNDINFLKEKRIRNRMARRELEAEGLYFSKQLEEKTTRLQQLRTYQYEVFDQRPGIPAELTVQNLARLEKEKNRANLAELAVDGDIATERQDLGDGQDDLGDGMELFP
ncbi:MAG: hypothetical protein LQ349_001118 [Xanthoria aureola]|nr:MAG: hypothetical protein LQ349_001118 [Xanthoria aureola]